MTTDQTALLLLIIGLLGVLTPAIPDDREHSTAYKIFSIFCFIISFLMLWIGASHLLGL